MLSHILSLPYTTFLSLLLAIAAAERLLFFPTHVLDTREWLDETFGVSPRNEKLAEQYNRRAIGVCAALSALVVWF